MAPLSPDDVLALARQRQEARKRTAAAARDLPWRAAFGGFLAVLLLSLVFWPGISLNGKLYLVVHGVCAQIHNVTIGGVQLPICARNTGIYGSALLTCIGLFLLGRGRAACSPPTSIVSALVVLFGIMVVDGLNATLFDRSLPYLYQPRNALRTLSGVGAGMALSIALMYIFNRTLLRAPERSTPLIMGWRELALFWLGNTLIVMAMYANVAISYWPLALIAWVGIVGIVYVANLLVVAVLLGYQRSVESVVQLARPATIALLSTGATLVVLAIVRIQREGFPSLIEHSGIIVRIVWGYAW